MILTDENLLMFSVPDSDDILYIIYADYAASSTNIPLKSDYEQLCWSYDNYFVTRQTGPESIVRIYDFKRRECVSEFRLEGDKNTIFGYAALSEDKRLLAVPVYSRAGTDNDYTYTIYLIIADDRTPPEGKYEYVKKVDYDSLNKQEKKAYDLGNKYGITINIYDEAINSYPTYVPETLTNNYFVDAALKCLENVLDKFPEGFFAELCSGEIKEMEFNITGKLNSKSDKKVVNARAFYYISTNSRHIIVADCSYTYKLEQTFAHEIMHAIDGYISAEFPHVKNDGYPDWYDYLPENFEFNESYYDKKGEPYSDTTYVFQGVNSSKRVYFLESYQKTYDFEDRAVLFQYMFVAGSGFSDGDAWYGLDSRFKNQRIYERAVYMCSILREYFETVKATEQTQWEKALGINADDLESSYNIVSSFGLCA